MCLKSNGIGVIKLIFGWLILRRINPFRVIQRRIKFQTIPFSISIVFAYKQINVKTDLHQTIQFSISTQFSSI